MYDEPTPAEMLGVATGVLRDRLLPALPPALAFEARVMANALDLVARQLAQGPGPSATAQASLAALGVRDDAELAAHIEAGALALDDPALLTHLWATTLARIAVDQPGYASYRAELQEQP